MSHWRQQTGQPTLPRYVCSHIAPEAGLKVCTLRGLRLPPQLPCLSLPCPTEYCERGSLYDILHAAAQSRSAAARLSWDLRLGMAIDAATGLLCALWWWRWCCAPPGGCGAGCRHGRSLRRPLPMLRLTRRSRLPARRRRYLHARSPPILHRDGARACMLCTCSKRLFVFVGQQAVHAGCRAVRAGLPALQRTLHRSPHRHSPAPCTTTRSQVPQLPC